MTKLCAFFALLLCWGGGQGCVKRKTKTLNYAATPPHYLIKFYWGCAMCSRVFRVRCEKCKRFCANTHTHKHTHTNTHTHTHTHMHTHTRTQVLDQIRQHSPSLVEQAQLVSHELIRMAILWHEMWHEVRVCACVCVNACVCVCLCASAYARGLVCQ